MTQRSPILIEFKITLSKKKRIYLSFREVQVLGELLPLRSDHVVVALEGVLQLQQLRGRECRPDALGLAERDEVVCGKREENRYAVRCLLLVSP